MTPGRILFVGLLLIAGALFVLNPGPGRFQEFLQETIAEQAAGAAGGFSGSSAAGFVAGRLGRAVGAAASGQFERENYYLASVYTTDLNGRMPGGEWRFLGVAGWFVVLDSPLDDL